MRILPNRQEIKETQQNGKTSVNSWIESQGEIICFPAGHNEENKGRAENRSS